MAARFPSKVKNPCVHLIVCFGPFLGADPHGSFLDHVVVFVDSLEGSRG